MKPKINRKSTTYKPVKYDQAQTPPWAVKPLIPYLARETIWECASGEGYLAEGLMDWGYQVFCSELDQVVEPRVSTLVGFNFLAQGADNIFSTHNPRYIITNPPYSGNLKQQFTQRCHEYRQKYNIAFALLMPVEFIGASSAQDIFDYYGGLQIIYLSTRVDFKMPEIGWTGKSTNKMRKNKHGKWVRQAGAQFPACWYCVGLDLPRDIMFAKLSPYRMETLNDPYHWDSPENEIEQLRLL